MDDLLYYDLSLDYFDLLGSPYLCQYHIDLNITALKYNYIERNFPLTSHKYFLFFFFPKGFIPFSPFILPDEIIVPDEISLGPLVNMICK